MRPLLGPPAPPPFEPLVAALINGRISRTNPDTRPGITAAVPGLVEQLTARELEVRGMPTGRPNQAIAA